MRLDELDDDDDGPDIEDDTAPLGAAEFMEELEDLIEREDLQYARETLEGIYETVRKTGWVTRAQLRAVNNIEAGADRRSGRW